MFDDNEIISHAAALLHWTPRVGQATAADIRAAGEVHRLTTQNFLRLYGSRFAELDPGAFELLDSYYE